MTTPVTLALVGTGRWGAAIAKTLQTIPECTLLYSVTDNWRELLDKQGIDGVIIATPPSTHAQIALPFIQKGIPTFIEKPLTDTLADARALEAAARAPVMVGHIHLFNPAYRKARELTKTIGPIRLVWGEGLSSGPHRKDYSVLWDWGPHDLSMILDVLGEMPERVSAWGTSALRPGTNLYDSSHMKLDFKNNVTGLVTSSWLTPTKLRRFTVVGQKGTIVYEDTLAENKLALYVGDKVSYPPYEQGLPLTAELQEFVRAIKTHKTPLNSVAEGVKVVQILEAAEHSIAQEGAPQMLA